MLYTETGVFPQCYTPNNIAGWGNGMEWSLKCLLHICCSHNPNWALWAQKLRKTCNVWLLHWQDTGWGPDATCVLYVGIDVWKMSLQFKPTSFYVITYHLSNDNLLQYIWNIYTKHVKHAVHGLNLALAELESSPQTIGCVLLSFPRLQLCHSFRLPHHVFPLDSYSAVAGFGH